MLEANGKAALDGQAVAENAQPDVRELSEKLERQEEKNRKLVEMRQSEKIYVIECEERIAELEAELRFVHARLSKEHETWVSRCDEILSSTSWRITAPLRAAVGLLGGAGRQKSSSAPAAQNASAAKKKLGKEQAEFNKRYLGNYEGVKNPFIPPCSVLEKQEAESVDGQIVFSIIVPLYNTPQKYLDALLRSVFCQTYPHWQLCLANASDEKNTHVEKTVLKYAKKDKRITYIKLAENLGISINSNAAIEIAHGDYIALLDHDDILAPNALYEMHLAAKSGADFIYSDEVNFVGDNLADYTKPHFKPDFAVDNMRANNYICHFTAFEKELLDKCGAFRPQFDGSQDWDLFLRLTAAAKNIVHVPKVLYFWRIHSNSVSSGVGAKPYAVKAAINAIEESLSAAGLKGKADTVKGLESVYKIDYEVNKKPQISIIIPNKDEVEALDRCIFSILEKTSYDNYEIIICENNSDDEKTFAYYEKLKREKRITIIEWKNEFNYSKINNFAAQHAKGEYLLFLNNDTQVISENWIEEMLMFCQRKDVGAVGAKLYYPNGTVQHAGIAVGIHGVAAHTQKGAKRTEHGYMAQLKYARNVSAVTAACMMIRTDVFEETGGFNENLPVAFNDIDLCLKIRQLGYLIVFTPFAELYHYESLSRGADIVSHKQKRLENEADIFRKTWEKQLEAGDPYFNPNFSRNSSDYEWNEPEY